MKKFGMIAFLFLSLMLVNVKIAAAQEADNDKFSFGKVVSVADGQVTIKEYDFAKDADVEVVYAVTPETELGNINALKDLVVNDDIVIDYVEKDGKRSITTLVKEEKGAEVPVVQTGDEVMAEPALDMGKAEGNEKSPAAEMEPIAPAAE